jgi:triacylglycerol lipase
MSNIALALQCARLSQEVYQEFAAIRFASTLGAEVTLVESQTPGVDTQAAILHEASQNRIFLVFRGSEDQTDWLNNVQFRQKTYPYGDESSTDVRFHRGFMTAYFGVRDRVTEIIKEFPQVELVVTGHSLGGALATVAALDLQYNITQHTQQPLSVYTFGAPRVGNAALIESFQRRVVNSYRYVYGRDLVTALPRWWQGYRHVPAQLNLGKSGFTWKFFTRRLKDHYIQNYVDALASELTGNN